MQLNLDAQSYRRLCLLADYHGTTPAWLVRRWVEANIGLEEELIRLKHAPGREGSPGAGGESSRS